MTSPSKNDLAATCEILTVATELTLASIRPDGTPHASTANFASSDLAVYIAVTIGCQKAYNVQHSGKVAFTANTPYRTWSEIRGVAIDADARFVTGAELGIASELLMQKYPQFASIVSNPAQLPWPGMLFIRCDPVRVALLDYSKGFGHTVHFDIAPGPITLANCSEQ